MRVVITRPAREAQLWAESVQAAGHEPIVIPLMAIEPLADASNLHEAWRRLGENAAVMFVSGNAVNFFMGARPLVPTEQSFDPILTRAWATGPGTRQALVARGWPSFLIDTPPDSAAQFDSEALWAVVKGQLVPGHQVLLVQGQTVAMAMQLESPQQVGAKRLLAAPDLEAAPDVGRGWLAQRIAEAGATPVYCVSYRRCMPALNAVSIRAIQGLAGAGTVWLFSSSEALNNLEAMLPGENWAHAHAVATHPRIGERARRAGFGAVRVARPTVADVLASIESLT